MLRKIRLSIAVIFFALVTLLFLDFTGTVHHWLGWMAKVQFLPALLALNVGVVLGLLALTLVLGRVYCSVICPLGVLQDVISWISARRKKKKHRFSYSPAKSWLRYGVLAVFVIAMVAGIGSFVALLAPYSSYGRIASNLFQPVYELINNLLAYWSERVDSYAFYSVDVWIRSLGTLAVAVVTFIVIAVLAWRNGRTYCNTICPVGTVLGFVARFSLLKMRIDADKCNKCSLCSRSCKSACIDFKNHKIDYSRCVSCMDCMTVCHQHAISYGRPLKAVTVAPNDETPTETKKSTVDISRRRALTATALVAVSSLAKAQSDTGGDGGLAEIIDKVKPDRQTPIVPPGSIGIRNFTKHCTACQLCVSKCPNNVLRPSTDLKTFMQPEMSYERGYCRPECTKCSEVCPAGAIKLITKEDKSATQIGHAVWNRELCVVCTDEVTCGNCARHCPTGAIQMVLKDPNAPAPAPGPFASAPLMIPVVDTSLCIGCGACEYYCPSRPLSAIHVEGHEMHRIV